MSKEEAIKYLNEFILFKKISNTTEEEAIECFKLAVEALQEHQHYKDLAESYEKTINKLTKVIAEEQLKTEGARGDIPLQQSVPEMPQPSECTETHECDYISRQAVLDGLASIAKVKAKSDAQKSLMGRIMFFIEKLSPVTPQPRMGRWLNQDEGAYYPIECSKCHKEAFVDDFGYRLSAYCPNCGSYNGGAK